MRKVKNAFIIVTHRKVTEKGIAKVAETCEFIDKIRNADYSSATVILDYMNDKVVKSRYDNTSYADLIAYIREHYPSKMEELDKLMTERLICR